MTFVLVLMFLWVLAPGWAACVKGPSHAADKARANIENLTCYSFGSSPEAAAATLPVDHLLNPNSRRSSVALVMTDSRHHALYEKKAEETTWPLPSVMDRLLKNLAKTTCPQFPSSQTAAAEASRGSATRSQAPATALIQSAAH
jgi:hypothetical protein